MHHCLRTPEIVLSICEQIPLGLKKTALSFALTTRAFLEPGLDRVWHTIASVEPIMACTPDELWSWEAIHESGEWGWVRIHILTSVV